MRRFLSDEGRRESNRKEDGENLGACAAGDTSHEEGRFPAASGQLRRVNTNYTQPT